MPRLPRHRPPLVPTISLAPAARPPLRWRQVLGLGLGVTVTGSLLWLGPLVHGMAAS